MSGLASHASTVQSLEEVLITGQLAHRADRPPDFAGENRALLQLTQSLADGSGGLLQKVVELAMVLCRADSAGISVLESEGGRSLRWAALAGTLAPYLDASIPQASPCGTAMDRKQLLLFDRPERFFPALRDVQPAIHEALSVPWKIHHQHIGTLWAISHRPGRHFDAEDARLLTNLSQSAAAAWILNERLQKVKEMKAERSAALNLVEDAVLARLEAEKATSALQETEERYRLIVESAHDYAIFTTDLNLRIVSWNPGAQALLGYTPEEIIGQSAALIFTPEDWQAGQVNREQVLEEGSFANERWYVRKDGSRFWGSGTTMRMRNGKGETIGFLKIMRDQTQQVLAQQTLEKTRDELERALLATAQARDEAENAGRAKDHFLAVLSHELRTPLTPALLSIRVLMRRTDLSPVAREALEMIRRNVEIESRIIDDLLDLTRISRGTLDIVRVSVDLHEVIREAADVVKFEIDAKEQILSLQLEAVSCLMKGDAARLQQIFWNVLRNASKFTPAQGRITVRTRNENDRIHVEIIDTGIGFEPADEERIFKAFVQADPTIARQFGGLGLGLAISLAIVEAHNGSIRASSQGLNQGATFAIDLPLGI